jgi:signal transduction histidine kinase/PAS domain-containing protein
MLLEAKSQFNIISDKAREVNILEDIADIYLHLGELDVALENQLMALEEQQKVGSQKDIAIALNNTGLIYKDLGLYPKAIELLEQSLKIKKEINYERGMIFSLRYLGEASRLNEDFIKSKSYLYETLKLEKKLNFSIGIGATHLFLGRLFADIKQYDTAESHLKIAMKLFKNENRLTRLSQCAIELAKLSKYLNKQDDIEHYLLKSIEYANKSQKNESLIQANKMLADFYAKNGDFELAFKQLKAYQETSKKIFNIKSQQRIEFLIIKNKIKENQDDLKLIKQQSKIKESELKNSINDRNLIILSGFCVVLLLGYFYKRTMFKRELRIINESKKDLSEKEQILSLALWASGGVLWTWDLQAKIIQRKNNINQSPLILENESFIENISQFIHPEDADEVIKNLSFIQEGTQNSLDISYRIKNETGNWVWVKDKGKVVKHTTNNTPFLVAGIQFDISALKQQENELVNLNLKLEQRVKLRTSELETMLEQLTMTQKTLIAAEKMASLGALTAGIAHELNTPLGTAVTSLSLLESKVKDLQEKVDSNRLTKDHLNDSLDSISGSSQILSRVLSKSTVLVEQFKRVAVSKEQLACGRMCITNLAESALNIARQSLNSEIQLELIIEKNIQISTYLDPFVQVLELLYKNAIQNVSSHQTLKLKTSIRETENSYEVIVEDNGVGVHSSEHKKIFEPFHTTRRHQGNVGLGLNIVFNLVVQLLDGDIYCDNSDMGGAKFVFSVTKLKDES